MWTQHNPSVPLAVIAIISKGCFWQISNVIIKFVFRAFLYLNPSTVILFWIGIGTLRSKLFRANMKLVHEVDLVCDHLYNIKRLWVTNREPPELCQYRFKRVWRTTFTRALLNHAPSSTQLHPPPLSSFQPPPSSLQHPQQYSNQNITVIE